MPAVTLTTVAFYEYFGIVQPLDYHYSHFVVAGFFVLAFYWLAAFRFRFAQIDALALSVLALIAADELWQTPLNIVNWTSSVRGLQIGLATGAWDLMAIPIFLYFLWRINRRLKLSEAARVLIISSVALTALVTFWFAQGELPNANGVYFLILPWSLFLLELARSNAPRLSG